MKKKQNKHRKAVEPVRMYFCLYYHTYVGMGLSGLKKNLKKQTLFWLHTSNIFGRVKNIHCSFIFKVSDMFRKHQNR